MNWDNAGVFMDIMVRIVARKCILAAITLHQKSIHMDDQFLPCVRSIVIPQEQCVSAVKEQNIQTVQLQRNVAFDIPRVLILEA